jgi:flagellar basal-body rod protein FlgC
MRLLISMALCLVAWNVLAYESRHLHYDSGDDLSAAMKMASSGMQAQSVRLKVISQNIANSQTTAKRPEDLPYQRKIVFFVNDIDDDGKSEVIRVDYIDTDDSEFILKYEPMHPAADRSGYVKYPNVNTVLESVDAKEAQRSFEANMYSYETSKNNRYKLIDLIAR